MRKLTIWLMGLFFIASIHLANAQTSVSGTVTSADDGSTLPGVSVIVQGTSIGTTTDMDGNYTLSVPDNATAVEFSFVGMEKQIIPFTGQTTINVEMRTSSKLLDEVLVVAYGTSTKKSFTGSATQISGEKLEQKNTSEITKALAGEVAGVQVINTTGQPGSNATIRIRGYGSINASRDPLFIVDGVPFDGSISNIDPADIATYTVLKDATATAIYGARGSNGVILVTTKKGEKGKGKIEVDYKRGVNMKLIPEYNVISDPGQFLELTWEGLRNKYEINGEANPAQLASTNIFTTGISDYYNLWNVANDQVIDPTTGKINPNASLKYQPDNWAKEIFHAGIKNEATVKFSGGNENSSYYSSVGYLGDEGYYINSKFERLSARLNIDHSIKKWLRGNMNIAFSHSNLSDPGQGTNANNGFAFVNNMPPIFPVYVRDANGDIVIDPKIGGPMYDYGFDRGTGVRAYSGNINPAGAVQLDKKNAIKNQTTINTNIEADIVKGLKFTSTFGAQILSSKESELRNPYYGDAEGIGRIYKDADDYLSYTWNQILSYGTTSKGHSIDAFIAHESSFYKRSIIFGDKSNIAHPEIVEFNNAVIIDDLGSYVVDYALESYFGQVRYDYNEKYFAHATIRRDGSSRFPNDKWGTFGSVGVAWMLSSESFFSNINFLNEVKLKASYGILGNQALGDYPTYDQYTISNLDNELSFSFTYKGNPNLTWEQSKTLNIGGEFNIKNILELEVEYFVKNTDRLLFNTQVAPSLGYSEYPVNDGALMNKGLEFSGLLHILSSQNMQLDVNFNGSLSSMEITRMPVDITTGLEKNIEIHGAFGWAAGHSIYDYYLREYAGVDPQTGEPLWNRYFIETDGVKEYITDMEAYKAQNPDASTDYQSETTNVYSEATLKFVGKSVIPKIMGGFGLNFGYKAFNLSSQFVYSVGGYGYDYIYAQQMDDGTPGSNNWNKDILNRWQQPGDITNVPRLTAGVDVDGNRSSTRFITSSSFLNLNNIRLSYELPVDLVKKFSLSHMSVWVAGDNLFVLSKRQGYTPVTSENSDSDRARYTPLSSITAGIKIQL